MTKGRLRTILAVIAFCFLFATAACAQSPNQNDISIKEGGVDISAVNQAVTDNGMQWKAGSTSVSGLSMDVMKKRLGNIETPLEQRVRPEINYTASSSKNGEKDINQEAINGLPTSLDWRNYNGRDWTTPVKDQGNCGSCWAFGAIGAVEARTKIARDDPSYIPDFSEQELVSCSDCGGCVGSVMPCPMDWMYRMGLFGEGCFAYTSGPTGSAGSCGGYTSASGDTPRITNTAKECSPVRENYLRDWWWVNNLEYSNVNAMKLALMHGPIVGSFLVYQDFQTYTSGIYEHATGSLVGGHAITIVGWGCESGKDYWICKNSWGNWWGESGWFRIRMGTDESTIESRGNVQPFLGDWDTIGVFRSGTWYINYINQPVTDQIIGFGLSGDLPITGNWVGTHTNNAVGEGIGVFRPSTRTWYLDYNNDGDADKVFNFGLNGDTPVAGDWTGDGKDGIGVFRTGTWYLSYNKDGVVDETIGFGLNGDQPVVGDWNGEGKDSIGVFRPSTRTWYLDYNMDGVADKVFDFGLNGDLAIAGDWNRDGKTDIGVFRPSTRTFYLQYNNVVKIFSYGLTGDIPVAGNFFHWRY
ncbi:MAG: C1 family peptidase [Methanothrix sp.]